MVTTWLHRRTTKLAEFLKWTLTIKLCAFEPSPTASSSIVTEDSRFDSYSPVLFWYPSFFFNLSACYVIIERNTVKEEEIHLNWKISAVSTKFFCLEFAAKTGSIPVANRPNRPVYLYRSLIHWLKMGRRRQRLMKRLAKRIWRQDMD